MKAETILINSSSSLPKKTFLVNIFFPFFAVLINSIKCSIGNKTSLLKVNFFMELSIIEPDISLLFFRQNLDMIFHH